uniref:Uncharacterized protein n=1 Tax=Graphocephala atropunctata TaxID=36148 RepID=A0A1B6LBG9_9HEMI
MLVTFLLLFLTDVTSAVEDGSYRSPTVLPSVNRRLQGNMELSPSTRNMNVTENTIPTSHSAPTMPPSFNHTLQGNIGLRLSYRNTNMTEDTPEESITEVGNRWMKIIPIFPCARCRKRHKHFC